MEHLTERLTTQFLFDRATRDEARSLRHLLTQYPRYAGQEEPGALSGLRAVS